MPQRQIDQPRSVFICLPARVHKSLLRRLKFMGEERTTVGSFPPLRPCKGNHHGWNSARRKGKVPPKFLKPTNFFAILRFMAVAISKFAAAKTPLDILELLLAVGRVHPVLPA